MDAASLLSLLNDRYRDAHAQYEEAFWRTYMGTASDPQVFVAAQDAWTAFKVDKALYSLVLQTLALTEKANKDYERLQYRETYFRLHAFPLHAQAEKKKAEEREALLKEKKSRLQTGYTDPQTNDFIPKSWASLGMIINTHPDEKVRKAAFLGREASAVMFVDDLIALVEYKNAFAQSMGYSNYYAYKAQTEEQMHAEEIWAIFDTVAATLIPMNETLLEHRFPNIMEPRNTQYAFAGDMTKQEDPYFPLQPMVRQWLQSFSHWGIGFAGATVHLDMFERTGKFNNGFCHAPAPVSRDHRGTPIVKRNPAHINISCIATVGQLGSGRNLGNTLFHEGGHAAHFANMQSPDIICNTEYVPASIARAETQSMLLDDLYSSIDWKMIYAKTLTGDSYPRSLYEQSSAAHYPIRHRDMLHICSVVKFEQLLYTMTPAERTPHRVITLAKDLSVHFFGHTTPHTRLLTIPHLYERYISCYYHGYGLATIAGEQWKKKLTDDYGYRINNPALGRDMIQGRAMGSCLPVTDLRQQAYGQTFCVDAFLASLSTPLSQQQADAKARIVKTPESTHSFEIDGIIRLVAGDTVLADSRDGRAEFLASREKQTGE